MLYFFTFCLSTINRSPDPAISFVEKQFNGKIKIKTGKVTEMEEAPDLIGSDGNTVDPQSKSDPWQSPIIK